MSLVWVWGGSRVGVCLAGFVGLGMCLGLGDWCVCVLCGFGEVGVFVLEGSVCLCWVWGGCLGLRVWVCLCLKGHCVCVCGGIWECWCV